MAASKQYTAPGTPIVFTDSGGNVNLDLASLAYGTGECSAEYDKGEGSQPDLYRVTASMSWDSAPIANETVEVYVVSHDGTVKPGGIVDDAAVAAAQLLNLGPPACIVVAQSTSQGPYVAQGIAYVPDRYLNVVVYNRSAGDNLENDASCFVTLTPMPPEMQ